MMELTNKRETYNVTNADSNLKLSGTFTYTADKRISDMSGSFHKLDESYAGGFNYYESEDGNASKNINSIPVSEQDKGCILLDATINSIKQQLTTE